MNSLDTRHLQTVEFAAPHGRDVTLLKILRINFSMHGIADRFESSDSMFCSRVK